MATTDSQTNHFIRFRNPEFLPAIISQVFLVIAAFLVILGLFYVILTVIGITIHNFFYDRDPKVVPDYVKRSVQFSSDEDESDFEYDLAAIDAFKQRKSSDKSLGAKSDWLKGQPTNAKKTQLLEKFLNDFNDMKRGNT